MRFPTFLCGNVSSFDIQHARNSIRDLLNIFKSFFSVCRLEWCYFSDSSFPKFLSDFLKMWFSCPDTRYNFQNVWFTSLWTLFFGFLLSEHEYHIYFLKSDNRFGYSMSKSSAQTLSKKTRHSDFYITFNLNQLLLHRNLIDAVDIHDWVQCVSMCLLFVQMFFQT